MFSYLSSHKRPIALQSAFKESKQYPAFNRTFEETFYNTTLVSELLRVQGELPVSGTVLRIMYINFI